MRTDAWRDGDLRISGLRLPDEAAREGKSVAGLLSVSQTTTYRWTLAEDLAGYARAGIGGIGLYRPKVEEADEEAAIDLVRSSSLAVASLSWIGGFTGSDGSRHEESLYDATEAIRFAAAVGAGTVAVVSGGTGNHIMKHARRVLVDALSRLCDAAGEIDVRLALHPMSQAVSAGQSIVTTLDQTLEVVDAVGRPNLGLVYDVGQLGLDPDAPKRVSAVAAYVHVVRLSEGRSRAGRRAGPAPASVMQAFGDAGYQGPFEFDLCPQASAAAGYDATLAACRSRFEALRSAVRVGE